MANTADVSERQDDLPDLLSAITADAAFAGGTGRGVRVGLIDSGVDADAGVRPAAQAVFRMAAGAPAEVPQPPARRSPHGSAVAQIITRLAPDVELYSADVLDDSGRGRADLVLAGLDWAIAHGCRLINVSLGLTPADLPRAERRWRFAEAVERAYFSGAVIVAAAHNHHDEGISAIPALFASVISVNKRLLGDPGRPGYRLNRNSEFEAYAKSLHPQYRYQAATSFAAPHVTGLLARLLERHPQLKPFEIKTILYRAGRTE